MRTTARDAFWLRQYIIPHVAPDIKYAYRSGRKYGEQTFSVGVGKTLVEVEADFKRHWAIWKGESTIVTRVYEKQDDGAWKYIARHEFKKKV